MHDIHQQGANGSRLFLPPYMQPVEPNVPKQIVEGYTELGNTMAADLRSHGFQGITTNSTYDAWTPSRAYSHYHGGVRILSETASARLATPITVKFEDLRPGEGYDPKKEAANFGPVWRGGEWHIGDMTTAAFSLLNNAATEREKWLSRFYEIGKEAVRPRKDGDLIAFVLPFEFKSYARREEGIRTGELDENTKLDFISRREKMIDILKRGGVEVDEPISLHVGANRYPIGSSVVNLSQPYGAFAKALFERQVYPNLLNENGNPIPPYDVTAQALPLLMGVQVEELRHRYTVGKGSSGRGSGFGEGCSEEPTYLTYKSIIPSMDEGWTRWVFSGTDDYRSGCGEFDSVTNRDIRAGNFTYAPAIVFPDQTPNQILNGYAKGSMPDEYVGGVGKEGVENLKKFVEAGGTLVFLNRSADFAIEQFGLPIKDVTKGLARKDFYIPGSILRTELDLTSPIAKGMPAQSIAWFENGPVFEVLAWSPGFSRPSAPPGGDTATQEPPKGGTPSVGAVRIIARYPTDPKQILLSGWALGAEKIAGKAALVEVTYGKGKIILFGFRPQYRGQSLATFPLLFNAISN